MRNSKPYDDISVDELLHVLSSDVGERFGLDPLCEVASSDEEPSSVSSYLWERSNYIQASLCKRPWTGKRV